MAEFTALTMFAATSPRIPHCHIIYPIFENCYMFCPASIASITPVIFGLSCRSSMMAVKMQNAEPFIPLGDHRLCVLASGSLILVVMNLLTLISTSCLHLGQNSGKFSSFVSCRSFTRVLLPQEGHRSHFSNSFITLTSLPYVRSIPHRSGPLVPPLVPMIRPTP